VEEVQSEYGYDIYYSAVKWIRKSILLSSFLHLQIGLDIFMMERDKTLPQLSDEK
jgi:hypothetical protein